MGRSSIAGRVAEGRADRTHPVSIRHRHHSLWTVTMSLEAVEGETAPTLSAAELGEGPRIVALGGGHGLSTLLRGLKRHTSNLTAIVTVADDGGSSGVLRRELGLLPPGDLRNCIIALAEAEPLMTRLFQYRFGRGTGLGGHAFGNLFIAALASVTGDFAKAVSEAGRVLAVQGRILPSSLENVVLCAEVRGPDNPDGDPRLICGQSSIARAGGSVERVYLQPSEVKGYPEATRAILHADMIVMGPGSLYTSVLPNLLITDIGNAIRASPALKAYVCNVATQPGETDGYDAGDHLRALRDHLGTGFCDYVVVNTNTAFQLATGSGSTMVRPRFPAADEPKIVMEDVVDRDLPWRHDPVRVAGSLMRLYQSVC